MNCQFSEICTQRSSSGAACLAYLTVFKRCNQGELEGNGLLFLFQLQARLSGLLASLQHGLDPGRRLRHLVDLRAHPQRLLRLARPHPPLILPLRDVRAAAASGLLPGQNLPSYISLRALDIGQLLQ